MAEQLVQFINIHVRASSRRHFCDKAAKGYSCALTTNMTSSMYTSSNRKIVTAAVLRYVPVAPTIAALSTTLLPLPDKEAQPIRW